MIPSVFKVLEHPALSFDVAAIIFGLLKKLIGDAAEPDKHSRESRHRLVQQEAIPDVQSDEEMDMEADKEKMRKVA